MKQSPFQFANIEPWPETHSDDWNQWQWQFRHGLKTLEDFANYFALTDSEKAGFTGLDTVFRVQSTPYYTSLAQRQQVDDPIRQMILPKGEELTTNFQAQFDPLGENKTDNRVAPRLIHRYTDRALFLVTDLCSVYCRYCTRKHFTGNNQVLATAEDVEKAVSYIQNHKEIREVIFSGGDPLTTTNKKLREYLEAFYQIPHVELIRIGTRMPVVCPMRIDEELVQMLRDYKPIYLMTHFNHPQEITVQSAEALERLVDHGVPVFNQMVLLNGINNHPALVQALSRRLLYLRVKPYYMFQADPSQGTDHLRTSIEDSLEIQKQLWGRTSGLMMPNYSIDVPSGGGKVPMVPNYQIEQDQNRRRFRGWDGVEEDYISPKEACISKPEVAPAYLEEWERLR